MRGQPGRDEDAGPRSPSFVKQISSAWLHVVVVSVGENPSRMFLVRNHRKRSQPGWARRWEGRANALVP